MAETNPAKAAMNRVDTSIPMETIWLIIIIGAGITSAFTGKVAGAKGYDEPMWAIGGFLFGPIALIAAAGMPDSRMRSYIRALAEEKGIKIEEVEQNNKIDISGGEAESRMARATPGQDFEVVCRIYRENGGKGDPNFKASDILARTILLKEESGDQLAYFSQRGDQMWHLVNIKK